jgi:hypothetical protein
MSPISAFTARRACHLLLSAGVLSASVLAGSLAPDAHASTGACTSEPVWNLSNGVQIDTTTNISNDPAATPPTWSNDVQSVNYTVQLPAGVSVVGPVVDTGSNGGILTPKDQFSYTSGPAGRYRVGVNVSTGTKATVSASTTLLHAPNPSVTQTGASGQSGQQLWMTVG